MLVRMSRPSWDEPASEIHVDPDVAIERIALDETSWVDVARSWVAGADALFAQLLDQVPWQTSRLFRYDHWVQERRLGAMWRPGTPPPHPALAEVQRKLQHRYRVQFQGFGLMQYRDGRDGQAFHRDTDMKWLDETTIALLSLGARRPWLLRPRTNRYDHSEGRGATVNIAPGPGDLLVMGGRCQADWEHSVPYRVGSPTGVRISIQWRHSRRARPSLRRRLVHRGLYLRQAALNGGPSGRGVDQSVDDRALSNACSAMSISCSVTTSGGIHRSTLPNVPAFIRIRWPSCEAVSSTAATRTGSGRPESGARNSVPTIRPGPRT